MLSLSQIVLTLVATLSLAGCQVEVQGGDGEMTPLEPEEPKQITAATSTYGVIAITTKVSANSLEVFFSELPTGARLECHLNQSPLNPCHDGAVYELPVTGSHKISAVAIKEDRIVAIGESKPFEVADRDDTGTSSDEDGLLLASTLEGFQAYAVHPLDQTFVAKFEFAGKPTCQPTIKCAFGQSSSQLWGRCDDGDKSFTVSPEMLATGPQTVKVRAQCEDTIGPELHFPLNAVPADYKPLMLIHRKDNNGRHTFDLLNPTDCLDDNARFECSEPNSEFTDCANSLVNPPNGTLVRLVCGADVGPALTID